MNVHGLQGSLSRIFLTVASLAVGCGGIAQTSDEDRHGGDSASGGISSGATFGAGGFATGGSETGGTFATGGAPASGGVSSTGEGAGDGVGAGGHTATDCGGRAVPPCGEPVLVDKSCVTDGLPTVAECALICGPSVGCAIFERGPVKWKVLCDCAI